MAVSTVGVVGAGQMGSGIAQVTAQAGVRVVMNDVSQEMCSHGLDGIGRNLAWCNAAASNPKSATA
jgi:3-hydroxybutyryl-CoA dehydrogenase